MIQIDVVKPDDYMKLTTISATESPDDLEYGIDRDGVSIKTRDNEQQLVVYISHEIINEMYNMSAYYRKNVKPA